VVRGIASGRYQILRKAADFSGSEELLLDDTVPIIAPTDWSRDGNYIAYTKPGSTTLGIRQLFSVPVNLTIGLGNEYAVSNDGSRFLVNVLSKPKPITVVLDWLALTKR
jgi:hypothetical protein